MCPLIDVRGSEAVVVVVCVPLLTRGVLSGRAWIWHVITLDLKNDETIHSRCTSQDTVTEM